MVDHPVVAEANYSQPILLNELLPLAIRHFLPTMASAVDFDDQLGRWTIEVNHIRSDRVLPPELKSSQAVAAKLAPYQAFRNCHILPEFPASSNHVP